MQVCTGNHGKVGERRGCSSAERGLRMIVFRKFLAADGDSG